MRIGFDIDGVLADFNKAFIDLIVHTTGANLFPARPFDIPMWDYPQHYGYNGAQLKEVWGIITASESFWATLPPYADAKETLNRLTEANQVEGHDVYFVTSRPGVRAKAQTEQWLWNNGYTGVPTVLISSRKGVSADAIELDTYIDDRDVNIVDVITTRGVKTRTYLVDRPWNRTDVAKHPQVDRVVSAYVAVKHMLGDY